MKAVFYEIIDKHIKNAIDGRDFATAGFLVDVKMDAEAIGTRVITPALMLLVHDLRNALEAEEQLNGN